MAASKDINENIKPESLRIVFESLLDDSDVEDEKPPAFAKRTTICTGDEALESEIKVDEMHAGESCTSLNRLSYSPGSDVDQYVRVFLQFFVTKIV